MDRVPKLDPPDFVTDFSGPRYDDAKKAMAKACKGKLPDDVAKNIFVGVCVKAGGKDTVCDCMWKKVRAKASPEEIAAGVIDSKAAGADACVPKK